MVDEGEGTTSSIYNENMNSNTRIQINIALAQQSLSPQSIAMLQIPQASAYHPIYTSLTHIYIYIYHDSPQPSLLELKAPINIFGNHSLFILIFSVCFVCLRCEFSLIAFIDITLLAFFLRSALPKKEFFFLYVLSCFCEM